jgi:hypothetical protein
MSIIGTDWDFSRLQELIDARGENVVVETAVACPCRNGDNYAATIERHGKPAAQRMLSCPDCRGDGFRYRNARCVKGLITGINPGRDRRLLESGYALPGDSVFSPSVYEQRLSDFDKITFQFAEPISEGQVIMRGAASLEENATFVTDLAVSEDRLWYEAACTIWCEDINGVLYTQGVDFEFEAKKIRWIEKGSSPDIGTLYTIKYQGYYEWVVYASPFERVDRGRNLGQRVLIRKKHVAFLTDAASDSVSQRKEDEIAFTTRTKI